MQKFRNPMGDTRRGSEGTFGREQKIYGNQNRTSCTLSETVDVLLSFSMSCMKPIHFQSEMESSTDWLGLDTFDVLVDFLTEIRRIQILFDVF